MTPRIEVGDFVRVDINGAQLNLIRRARVDGKPQATGDSWIFWDVDLRRAVYVSEGCTITKIEDADPSVPF